MGFSSPIDFLERCSESSHAAYDALKSLLDFGSTPEKLSQVRRFLSQLIRHCDEMDEGTEDFVHKYHFSFAILTLDGHNPAGQQLRLLQLPSIFTPEDWSFTFFEGLARYPATEFQGRLIAELGCGNGWISIALAQKNLPQKIYGLDINPRAITCARINLVLNALDDSGTPRIDADGKCLLDRVEFHVSDLLGFMIEKSIQLDRVIGCIPQVLSPEPLMASSFVSEDSNDHDLHALSNYCEKQGYIEDQFGLGLIARAVEESIEVCKPSAKIILNMGGRPGTAVLDRLFTRRGFAIRKIWSTKVWQAEDTDIQPLVEIEKGSPHRFEFFTSLTSDEPICAQTANAYAKAGGRISHSLIVYEATLRHPAPTKSLFKLIAQRGFEDSRNGLDLSFNSDDIAEEKINFIGNIADWLQKNPGLPYSDTEGEPQLRRQIAQYLRSYWKVPITAKSVFIAPTRRSVIKNFLQIFNPAVALIDRELGTHVTQTRFIPESQGARNPFVLEAPRRADEVGKLVEKLKPQLVITSLQEFEIRTNDAFARLCEICAVNSTHLVIDISQHFELSSQPSGHGILSHIADNRLPAHVTLLCGLVRNKVYSDLELSFVLSENSRLLEQLSAAAELSYSRTPLLTQKYYSRIFSDLLNFQLTDLRRSKSDVLRLPTESEFSTEVMPPAHVITAFNHPAIKTNGLELNQNTIRLDYGENCLKSPEQLHAAIIEGYLRQNISSQETSVEQSIVNFVNSRFGLAEVPASTVAVGTGVAPIFAALLETITGNNEKIIMPSGAYGHFVAASHFFNTNHVVAKTSERNRFKLTPQQLDDTLSLSGAHWLYLNAPVVNPTGAIYSGSEMLELSEVLQQHKCGLILDTIFSGLEFDKLHSQFNLDRILMNAGTTKVPFVLMGGVSKELAAGGFRFGWALSPVEQLVASIKSRQSALPHSTTRYAARKIYQALAEANHPVHVTLDSQRKVLKKRSEQLIKMLEETGWDVVQPEGGLFVCASPRKYLEGLRTKWDSEIAFDETSAADSIAQKIFNETGLLLNNATWTGLPSHLRFVISIDELEFERAIGKIRDFDANWQCSTQ
ncbi:MAG: aminotransferase class I/II-fold pyridoxal phosphate-dependent enzyme [Silvanigrellaceae bacterium]